MSCQAQLQKCFADLTVAAQQVCGSTKRCWHKYKCLTALLESGVGHPVDAHPDASCLQLEGCQPNVVTYNTLVDVYGKIGRPADAVATLDTMQMAVSQNCQAYRTPNFVWHCMFCWPCSRPGRKPLQFCEQNCRG